MEPFYSLYDLTNYFDQSVENIADALRASGVPMIFNNEEADLSGWRRSPPKNPSGPMIAVRGKTIWPDPDEVFVSTERLPPSWVARIAKIEREEVEDDERAIDPRRERNLLRIIRALDGMAGLPPRGAATSVVAELERLGFSSPGDDTVAKTIATARTLEPE